MSKIHYNKIRKMDIANGPGVRVTIFFQGCDFHCKGCFNPDTWKFGCGKDFTDETIEHILELCDKEYIAGLSMLGGEPMHPNNIEGSTKLAKAFKEKFPKKSLWSWTGFTYEEIKDNEIFEYLDVLIDGQFKAELFSPKLRWKGSSNQRVIDIKKTRKSDKIVLFKDEEY